MSILKVEATEHVAGELVLTTLGPTVALKKGDSAVLSEKQYWAEDIQRCLTMKPPKLRLVEGAVEANADYTDIVALLGMKEGGGTLTLPTIPNGVRFNQMVELPLRHYKNTDIQQALARGYLKVLTQEEYDAVIRSMEKKAATKKTPALTPQDDPEAIKHLQSLITKKPAEVSVTKLGNINIAAVPAERDGVDVTVLDEAERYRLTGTAAVVNHHKPPTTAGQAKAITPGKRIIKRSGGDEEAGGGEDGVFMDVS